MDVKKILKVDPLKSFYELPILWLFVIILLSISVVITYIIILNSNLNYSLDYKGINSLLEVFKVPLSILALIISFVAILAIIHRSVQIREQILISSKQNVFSNYYKHIEEFEKYMNSGILGKSVHFINLRATHRYLFPQSFEGNYSVNGEFLGTVDKEYSKFIILLNKFNLDENKYKSVFEIVFEVSSSIDIIFSLLNMKIRRSGRQVIENGKKIIVSELDLRSALSDIKIISLVLVQILSFDHYIIIPNSLIKINNINLSVVPDWNFLVQNTVGKFDLFNI